MSKKVRAVAVLDTALVIVIVLGLAVVFMAVSADARWRETHNCVRYERRVDMRAMPVGRVTVVSPYEHDVCVAWTPKR